jgi:hypothetical protein
MFDDLDETLRNLLVREVPLNPNEVDINFDRPDRENIARYSKPTVNLFLFDLTENRDLRETGWHPVRVNENGIVTLKWPPTRVDVRYLVTAWAQEVDDEHRLLYHMYRTLNRVAMIPEEGREGAIENQTKPMHLIVEDQAISDLVDMWTVLDNKLNPGFVLKCTLAMDLNGDRNVPPVRTARFGFKPYGYPAEYRNSLGGSVTDAQGQPVAGARVMVQGRMVTTDDEGRFRTPPLMERGDGVEIAVQAEGFASVTERRDLPTRYDVTLEPSDVAPPTNGGDGAGGRGRRRR